MKILYPGLRNYAQTYVDENNNRTNNSEKNDPHENAKVQLT